MKLFLILFLAPWLAMAETQAAAVAKVSKEDILKTVEHQAQLVKDAEAKMAQAQAQTAAAQAAEADAQAAEKTAQESAVALQGRIDQQAKDLAAQTARADKFEAADKKDKANADLYARRLSMLCVILAAMVAAVAAVIAFDCLADKAPPWSYLAPIIAFAGVSGFVFFGLRFWVWKL